MRRRIRLLNLVNRPPWELDRARRAAERSAERAAKHAVDRILWEGPPSGSRIDPKAWADWHRHGLAGLPWQQRSHLQRPIVRDRCDVPRHESDRTGRRRICLSTKVAPDLRGQKPSWPAVCSQSGARQTSLPVPRRALDGAKDRERESADRGGAAAEIGYPDADTVPEIPAPIVDPDGGAPGSDPDQKSCILRTLSFCTRASSEACGKEFQGAASARRQQTSSGPLTFS
jgi:hypothetical protein